MSLILNHLLSRCFFSIPILLIGLLIFSPGIEAVNRTKQKTSDYTKRSGGQVAVLKKGLSMPHADLRFTVFPEEKKIGGIAILTLSADTDRRKIALDLDRVFKIREIQFNGNQLSKHLYRNPDGLLEIQLPEVVKGDFKLLISYIGHPKVAENAPWDSGFVWAKTRNKQHWIATAVQDEGGDLFWPCLDHPKGEPGSVDIHITVPAPLVAVANGTFMGRAKNGNDWTYHWQTKYRTNTYGIALNIAPYRLMQQSYASIYGNKIDIRFYYLPQSEKKISALFSEIPAMLDFFERTIGPYPFASEKAGFVETPHLGMEHQTVNAYGNKFLKDEFGFDRLMQHELSHEWFGNQVTASDWDHMWLHEGFGAYMQPLYARYLHGNMAYLAYLYKQRQGIANRYPLVFGKSRTGWEAFDSTKNSGGDIYVKGSLVLHSLRELIGDQAFYAATRELVYGNIDPKPGNFEPRFASTADFIKLINRHSGQKLNWFFNVYVKQAALPELIIDRKPDFIRLAWQVPNDLPFPMPLEVSVNGKLQVLDLASPKQIPAKSEDIVIVDPNSKVLRADAHIKAYQEFLMQKARQKGKK